MASRRLLVSGLLSVAGLCFLLLISSSASAATLNVVGGQLLGASGVIVDGSSYNVAFLDGTCIALYSGCDDVSDFTFQTSADAVLASQALLDQVFLDGANLFDTEPGLTNGCAPGVTLCGVFTPYNWDMGGMAYVRVAANYDAEVDDYVGSASAIRDLSLAWYEVFTYAVWEPAPTVPSLSHRAAARLVAVLCGVGLVSLSTSHHREV